MMYHMRRRIKNGIDVDVGLRSLGYVVRDDLEPLMDEALQSKCPEDGQTLLMYAAAQGNKDWFLHLVGDIKARVGSGENSNLSCPVHFSMAKILPYISRGHYDANMGRVPWSVASPPPV